jgi:hypothetical protein
LLAYYGQEFITADLQVNV